MTKNADNGNILDKLFNNDNETSEELLELKKKLAEDIADKLDVSEPFKGYVVDYLVEEGEKNIIGLKDYEGIKDNVGDKAIEKIFGSLGLITPQLMEFREDINKQTTKEGLEELKTRIFKKIGGESEDTQESTDSSSTSAATTGAVGAGAGALASSSSQNKTTKEGKESSGTTEKAKVGSSGESYEIDHFNITVSPEHKKLWDSLKGKEKPDLEPFACAMKAYEAEKAKGHLKNEKYLTVVDFTKNQLTHNRFFVINLDTNTVEEAQKCGHGDGSGDKERATSFGNVSGSHKSSLGASIIPSTMRKNSKGTWEGAFPKGLEGSNNASRGIAIHPVKSLVYKTGRPTSQGCFTLTCGQSGVNDIIEKTGDGMLFAYAKSKDYFSQSDYFQKNSDGSYAA